MPSAHSNGHAPESRQGAVRPYEGKGPCAHVEVAGEPGVGAGTPSKRVARAKPSGDAGKADSPFRMAERLWNGNPFRDNFLRDSCLPT